jgi:hypothetical protein
LIAEFENDRREIKIQFKINLLIYFQVQSHRKREKVLLDSTSALQFGFGTSHGPTPILAALLGPPAVRINGAPAGTHPGPRRSTGAEARFGWKKLFRDQFHEFYLNYLGFVGVSS